MSVKLRIEKEGREKERDKDIEYIKEPEDKAEDKTQARGRRQCAGGGMGAPGKRRGSYWRAGDEASQVIGPVMD